MKRALFLCALGAALLGSQVAKADTTDTFSGSASFTDLGPVNGIVFTGAFSNPNFSFTGGQGSTYTDTLNLATVDGRLLNSTQTDNLQVELEFTLPSSESATIDGSGSIHDTYIFIGWLDHDTISWQNATDIPVTFADGSALSLSLANVTFNGVDGISLGNDPLTMTVTNVGATPEPGSLALLGTSVLGGIGILRRRIRA